VDGQQLDLGASKKIPMHGNNLLGAIMDLGCTEWLYDYWLFICISGKSDFISSAVKKI